MKPMHSLYDGRRVHRKAYVDPEVFDHEMDAVFGGTWVYLAHESQLPGPNSFVTVSIGRRPVIVTRDNDGGYNALLNRCTHRAAELCTEAVGVAKRFACPYHGWTFNNDGSLVAVPFPGAYGDDFERSAYDLGRFHRVEAIEGFIFGSLRSEVPNLRDHLGVAGDYLAEWRSLAPDGDVRLESGARRIQIAGNWKLCWDNAADGYHAGFVHTSLLAMTAERHGAGKSLSHFDRDPDKGPMQSIDIGRGHSLLDQRPSIAEDRWSHARPVPAAEELVAELIASAPDATEQLQLVPGAGMNLSVFPNLFISGNLVATLEPVAVGLTNMTSWAVTYGAAPAAVNHLRLRYCEDFTSFGEPDDIEVWERTQRALSIGEMEWIDVSRGDGLESADTQPRTVPITYETCLRSYLREWADLCDAGGM